MKIVDLIIERQYELNIWAYARVDTIVPGNLARMKKAGINWLALGIESANAKVRDAVSKNIKENDITSVVKIIQDAGIRVLGNFILGLPEDDLKTMHQTLNMAKILNCEFANFYCAMAYPGSKLYDLAIQENWSLPANWLAYSQHSYETQPLPTRHLSANEVLKFRDNAFHEYFSNSAYLETIQQKFGRDARSQIESMADIKLKRRLLGD